MIVNVWWVLHRPSYTALRDLVFSCALIVHFNQTFKGWVSVNVPVGSFVWGEYRGHRRLMWQQQGVVLPLYTNDIIINSLILNHSLGYLQEGSSVLQPLVFPYLRAMCQICYSLCFDSMHLSFEPAVVLAAAPTQSVRRDLSHPA